MTRSNHTNIKIHVNQDDKVNELLLIDKNKLQMILINLINNAKDSVLSSPKNNKEILLDIKFELKNILISVKDNGMGIPANDLKCIFFHGYTTKKEGHGFGLHSCALAANELNGKLNAYSKGREEGATFVLTLPYKKGDE